MSRGYLNRMFRQHFALSAAGGLELARCSRAEALIAHTDLTLDRVAQLCGFADAAHLSHRFGHRYGVPPGAFRSPRRPSRSVLDDAGVRRLVQLIWD